MFAEDIGLLPKDAFLTLLTTHRDDPATLQIMLRCLWADMDSGGFCMALAKKVLHFNGKLFKHSTVDGYSLLLKPDQIDLLIAAAKADWRSVEPAIFGALLERTLHPTERHALGAHYTPRAYIERLVLPTVMEPLRAEWANAQAAALVLAHEAAELTGRAMTDKLTEARAEVKKFHHRLCSLRVLDPACGSANFLYVTLEHLKRLEGEVINQLLALGETQDRLGFEGETVTVQQLRGIESNPRAAAVAELVLWIGFLQWHIRTQGNTAVAEPVVHDFENIECRDAVLAWDKMELRTDGSDQPVTCWDGKTFKRHTATGEQVPDETAQMPQWTYTNPRCAAWPVADFVVGNPPYLGARTIRAALGDGYLSALRRVYVEIPDNADYVMYWWDRAASLVGAGQIVRFGLITTNSLRQSFNRAVVAKHLGDDVSLAFVVPDHPWVDSADGAAVRVALSVGQKGKAEGQLLEVIEERPLPDGEIDVDLSLRTGIITPGLTIGPDIAAAPALRANAGMSCVGYQLTGKGFVVTADQARLLDPAFGTPASCIRPLLSGRDITQTPRHLFAIDLYGLSDMQLRERWPAIDQWVNDRVKGERDVNACPALRERWWIFGAARSTFRPALKDCTRVITTSLTAKHRTFVVAPVHTICDSTTVMFALPDAFYLGVLSSDLHVAWSLASGGTLEDRPRYIKTLCFDNFPFPSDTTGLTSALRQRIAQLAESIDAHRQRQQAAHPGLTLTSLYNVLQRLRCKTGEHTLTAAEQSIYSQGLVGMLKDLHDELDAAVLAAYGWRDVLPTARSETGRRELLTRLVALNARRAADEAKCIIQWLRPDFQNPLSKQELPTQVQQGLEVDLPVNHQAEIDSV
jgi:hypothetical protein